MQSGIYWRLFSVPFLDRLEYYYGKSEDIITVPNTYATEAAAFSPFLTVWGLCIIATYSAVVMSAQIIYIPSMRTQPRTN